MLRETVLVAFAAILLSLPPPAFARAPLFEAVDPSGGAFALAPTDDDPTILRQRPVRLNERALGPQDPAAFALEPGPTAVMMNFFDDASFYVVVQGMEETPSGKGIVRTGVIEGRPASEAILVTEEGVTIGDVRDGEGGTYQILLDPSGIPLVRQIDDSRFPPEAPPIPVDETEAPVAEDADEPSLTREELDLSGALADDGSIIDVMVLYTPSARKATGGAVAMTNRINLAVTQTNSGYQRSGVTQRVRLVHAQEVSYNEATGDPFSDALGRLRATKDGVMDVAHTLRNAYAADMVVLLINNIQYCGLGYLMTSQSAAFAASAFSVNHYACATGNYTFAHEMGHNQGSNHDHAHAGYALFPYGFGYQHPSSPKFYTIMAYACPGCVRINNWSNPAVSYSGVVTGRAASVSSPANNTLSLNNTRVTVANWRQSKFKVAPAKVTPLSPTGNVYTNKPAYRWNALSNASKYQLAVWVGSTLKWAAWLPATSVGCGAGTGVCSYSPNVLLTSAASTWRVTAASPAGNGPWGDKTAFTPKVPVPSEQVWPKQGTVLTTKRPTFQWRRNGTATSYILQVKDATGWKINTWYTAAQAGCAAAGSTCRIYSPITLNKGSHQWQFRGRNAVGIGALSGPVTFTAP